MIYLKKFNENTENLYSEHPYKDFYWDILVGNKREMLSDSVIYLIRDLIKGVEISIDDSMIIIGNPNLHNFRIFESDDEYYYVFEPAMKPKVWKCDSLNGLKQCIKDIILNDKRSSLIFIPD